MDIVGELQRRATTLVERLGAGTTDSELAARIVVLDDAELMAVLSDATALGKAVDRLRTLATGAVARRSTREAGQDGLAQTHGHRTTVTLLQDLQGTTRTDAAKQVRVAEALLDGVLGVEADVETSDGGADRGGTSGPDEAGAGEAPRPRLVVAPWHEPIDHALLEGGVSPAQADAIRRGLGEPPVRGDAVDREVGEEAWRVAAEQLVREAPSCTVEELAGAARYLRDELDPEGAENRYLERHARRRFRMWTDADGIEHGHFTFDDDGAAWMRSMIDAALRPRRGGPRFVDSEEAERAQRLVDDPRTNDQLAYDLVLDILRAGTAASAEEVFGTRLAGVRIVRVVDPTEKRPGVGHLEDGGAPIPAAAIEQSVCQSGTVSVTVDPAGNPLDVGRDRRLFTPRQRIALAVRDGGCLWPGCDRPASFCESHHIDPRSQGGRTDIDRGILVCWFHHMNLHHHGWRIRRSGSAFLLHPPEGDPPTVLQSRSPLRRKRDRKRAAPDIARRLWQRPLTPPRRA